MPALYIEGARVLLPEGLEDTSVRVENGQIVEIGGTAQGAAVVDGSGRILAPALIDVHGDAFERQVMPRPGVFFPLDMAILDTDRQLAANGIATAYHAVTLGWEPGLRDVARGRAFIEGLRTLAPRLTVENRVQLRWETFAFEAEELIAEELNNPLTPSLAFNDHTSMVMRSFDTPLQARAFEHAPEFRVADPRDARMRQRVESTAKRAGLEVPAYLALMEKVWARRPEVPDHIASLGAKAQAVGAPMLSHDDTQADTRAFYRSHGARVCEFPMTLAPARDARAHGDHILFGAPNVVRGGSHIGSLSAAEMVEDGLCDGLASDYFYPALLTAVDRLHRERRAPLPTLWSLVSRGPARAMGLMDRGEVAVGQRADLVLLDWPEGAPPAVTATWVGGRAAFRAEAPGR